MFMLNASAKRHYLLPTLVFISLFLLLIGYIYFNTEDFRYVLQNKNSQVTKIQPDSRILLTPENIQNFNVISKKSCEEEFNTDSATESVTYFNQDKGISVKIPYNPMWGSPKYRLRPYDEFSDYLAFGPLRIFEACLWERSYFLEFLPVTTIKPIMEDIKSLESLSFDPVEVSINNLTVLKYEKSQELIGLCNWPTLHVIGVKYSYALFPLCGTDSTEEFSYLEQIVKTIKLIE
jgi:hypothetical protein